MMDWIDTLWTVAMWVLLGTAAAVVAWAVLGDWWRGKRAIGRGGERRRCGKCWYDMRGIAGLVCPECGRAAKNERGLQRSRVRWRLLLLALPLLVPAWVAARMPDVRAHGWLRLVPTPVIACWKMDVGAWEKGKPIDWAGSELEGRNTRETADWLTERILARRIASVWRVDCIKDWAVEVIDTRCIARDVARWESRSPRSAVAMWKRAVRSDAAQSVCGLLTSKSSAYGNYASPFGRVSAIGDLLVVACSQDRMSRLRRVFDLIERGESTPWITEFDDLTVINARLAVTDYWEWGSNGTSELHAVIGNHVDAFARLGEGHVSSLIRWPNGVITVTGRETYRDRVAELMASFRATTVGLSSQRLEPFPIVLNEQPATEYVAMWTVRPILRTWGAMTLAEYDAWVAESPGERTPNAAQRGGDELTRGTLEKEAAADLASFISGEIFRWGEERVSVVHGVLILSTVKPENVDRVDVLLREASLGRK